MLGTCAGRFALHDSNLTFRQHGLPHFVPRECTSSEIYIYFKKKQKKKPINFHFFWLITIFYGVGDVTAQEAVELMLMSVSIKSHGVL